MLNFRILILSILFLKLFSLSLVYAQEPLEDYFLQGILYKNNDPQKPYVGNIEIGPDGDHFSSDVITWNPSISSNLPIYVDLVTNIPDKANDVIESSDKCLEDLRSVYDEWASECGYVIDFSEVNTLNPIPIEIEWSTNNNLFQEKDGGVPGGVTYSSVDKNDQKHFSVSNSNPLESGVSYSVIFLNNSSTRNFNWTTYFILFYPETYVNFYNILLHEFGHLVGLGDNPKDPDCIMYPSQPVGNISEKSINNTDEDNLSWYVDILVPVCETCPPAAPTGLSATISGQNVVLTWNPYLNGLGASLQIIKNNQIYGSPFSTSQTSFIDNNAANSLPAKYQIAAFNGHGYSYSNSVNLIVAPSTISSNTLWTGVVYVNSNVNITATGNLIIGANTKVIFNAGHNYSIICEGKLNSQGVNYGSVLFSSNSTNPAVNNWGNIFLSGSGASGSTIEYTNIQYGNGIQVINVPDFEISNCNFLNNYVSIYCGGSIGSILNNYLSSNSIGHSIQLNLSTVTCNKNKIKKIDSGAKRGHGILFGGGSHGSAWQNDIYNVDWGIGSIWSSSVDCYNSNYYNEPNDERNNRITNCNYGVRIYNNSYPILGRPISVYGYSTIKNNSVDVSLNTDNITASNLEAYEIYWNNGDYSHAIVQKGNGSNIIHAPEATSDQWQNIPFPKIQSPPNMKSNNAIASIDANSNSDKASNVSKESSSVEVFDSLFTGINLRHQKKLIEAKDYFISYLSKHPEDQRAYTELYNCEDKQTIKEILTFFKTLPKQASKEQGLLLSYLYQKEGDIQSAKKINNALIKKYPNTPLSARANIENMYILLYSENNLNDAVDIFKDVLKEAQLSTSTELKDAEYALESYARIHEKPIPDFDALKKALSSAINQNEEFSLLGNYPNPFNPSTTISYNLPRTSNVEIIVYDILGNKIKSFNISSQNAGKQHVVWNGTNGNNQQVASGIYLYHFKAMSLEGKNEIFEKTAKLLLLK